MCFKSSLPVLSAEIFLIPLEKDKYIVYAPLRKVAFVANVSTVDFLVDLKEGIYNREVDSDSSIVEFLRRMEIVDAGEENPPLHICEGVPQPVALSLFLTTACNLRCDYCYASAGETAHEKMPLHIARKGIDFVIANALELKTEQIELNYHGGGEPTVHWAGLTRSYDYAREKAEGCGLTVHASTATNGMLNDKQIDWITAHLQSVSLSFDGLPEAQDRHRVTPKGKGSAQKVIHTLQRFDEAGLSYGIRMTATAELIPLLPDSIDYIFSSFKVESVQIEPAFKLGRYVNRMPTETEEFLAAYRESKRRAARYGKEISYSGARISHLSNHFCAVSQDSFALLPDGTVSSCFEACTHNSPNSDLFFYGKQDRDGNHVFDPGKLRFLRQQAVQFRVHCKSCFAKWTCAGDCLYKAISVNGGSGEFSGTTRCHINRELTKDLIIDKIIEAGGLCWHEPRTCSTASSQNISTTQNFYSS